LHFLIEMMWRSLLRGVQTTITIRPARNPTVWKRNFAIVPPDVLGRDRQASEDDRRIRKV